MLFLLQRFLADNDGRRFLMPAMISLPEIPPLTFAGWQQLPAARTVLLTVNARLRRALENEWLGSRTAAPAPAVHTPAQWLESAVRPLLLRGDLLPDCTRLTAFEEIWLWEQVVRADRDSNLLDTHDAARLARDAHALLQEWPQPDPASDMSTEYARYLEWQKHFHTTCARRKLLDEARWQVQLRQALQDTPRLWPGHLVLAGLDDLSPAWLALLHTLQAGGVQLHRLVREAAPVQRCQIACADAMDELQQAIAWAGSEIAAGQRVALVLPDLGARRATVTRLLDIALHPATADPGLYEQARRYNISLGEPLSGQPPVRAALAALGLLLAPEWYLPEVCPWLCSPWLCSASELTAQALREAEWRRSGRSRMSWKQLRHESWAACWLEARTTLGAGEQLLPSVWAQRVSAALQQTGWPGSRTLSSHEFQMLDAWRDELQRWSQLDDVCGRLDGQRALALLRRALDQRIFQPQSEADAPLQVLGLLETAGGTFDAVWVLGMTDKTLPARPQPNPLLPVRWQRQQQTPHSSSAREAAFARRLLADLETCAPRLRVSWPGFDGETELRPSPLIAHWDKAPPMGATRTWTAAAALQQLNDDQGLPLTAGRRVQGGARVLELQARHPQWAYAECRLGARALEPWSTWPDARLRGNLAHAVLEALWQGVPGQSELLQMDDAGEREHIRRALDAALTADAKRLQELCGRNWLDLERRRLQRLTRRWLQLERSRPVPFRIAGLEVERHWEHGALRLKLRIDRIDRIGDGLLLIDYKTGRVSTAGWGNADDKPLVDVQLPLYATLLGQDEPVCGTAFASLHAREFGFKASLETPHLLVAARKEPSPDDLEAAAARWKAQQEFWREALARLADEFCAGMAEHRARLPNALQYCHIRPFLRELATDDSEQDSEHDSAPSAL